jgi:ABC-2 type transport system ATP-binding protein
VTNLITPRTSIAVEHVTKDFKLRYHRTLKQVLVARAKGEQTYERFVAVDDVSFTIEQGESVGLMGLNGSGKSTLLKMILGVMKPQTGSVQTRGRIAGLIATGAGFHHMLTGRENIYLNAAVLGMSAKEVDKVFDDIVEFADIGTFIDMPVGMYSSGMHSRLGFAISIHVDSDIFLIDEALAVGDKPFKLKCMEKIAEISQSGRTIIYVSHAAGSVAKLCERALVLEKGRLGFDGPTLDAFRYLGWDDEADAVEASRAAKEAENAGFLSDAILGADI